MHGRFALPLAAAVLAFAGSAPAAAQPALKLSVELPASAVHEGPTVIIENAFLDSRSIELLSSGFPGRIIATVELWQDRSWFDGLLQTTTWQRVIAYNALNKVYHVGRVERDSTIEEGRFATLDEVRRWVAQRTRAPLTPPPGVRGLYYSATVTIETLNSNDLDEVRRWLKGDVKPAIKGEANPGSALGRGFRTLLSRVFGGDTKRVTKSSARFDT